MIRKVYDSIVVSLDLDVTVRNSFDTDNSEKIIAKVDTGATASFIHSDIAKRLNLQALGSFIISTANGPVTGIQYLVDFYVNDEAFKTIPVIALPNMGSAMLIGMDFLKNGTTKISTDTGTTVFEFFTQFSIAKFLDKLKVISKLVNKRPVPAGLLLWAS